MHVWSNIKWKRYDLYPVFFPRGGKKPCDSWIFPWIMLRMFLDNQCAGPEEKLWYQGKWCWQRGKFFLCTCPLKLRHPLPLISSWWHEGAYMFQNEGAYMFVEPAQDQCPLKIRNKGRGLWGELVGSCTFHHHIIWGEEWSTIGVTPTCFLVAHFLAGRMWAL